MYFKLHLWCDKWHEHHQCRQHRKVSGELDQCCVPSWLQDCELAWRPGVKKFTPVELSVEASVPRFQPWSTWFSHWAVLSVVFPAPTSPPIPSSGTVPFQHGIEPAWPRKPQCATNPGTGQRCHRCTSNRLFSHWTICCACQLAVKPSTSVSDLFDVIFREKMGNLTFGASFLWKPCRHDVSADFELWGDAANGSFLPSSIAALLAAHANRPLQVLLEWNDSESMKDWKTCPKTIPLIQGTIK